MFKLIDDFVDDDSDYDDYKDNDDAPDHDNHECTQVAFVPADVVVNKSFHFCH